MTVRQHFALLAKFFDAWDMGAAVNLAHALDVPTDKPLAGLSRGTSVKVALCSAWGQRAEILLLDEPTAGLDPVARVEFLGQLEDQISGASNLTVVIATHILEDLDYLSITDLMLLRDGACEHLRPDQPLPLGAGSAAARQLLNIESKVEL